MSCYSNHRHTGDAYLGTRKFASAWPAYYPGTPHVQYLQEENGLNSLSRPLAPPTAGIPTIPQMNASSAHIPGTVLLPQMPVGSGPLLPPNAVPSTATEQALAQQSMANIAVQQAQSCGPYGTMGLQFGMATAGCQPVLAVAPPTWRTSYGMLQSHAADVMFLSGAV